MNDTTHKILIICCILLARGLCVEAQVHDVIPSGSGIANTTIARNDRWEAFQNPAALVQKERFQAAIQYENRYLSAELSTVLLQTAYTNPYVNVGIAYSFFGYARYSEMMAAVTLARSFGRFSIGLQGDIISIYCGDDIGYRTTVVPQLGINVDITKKLSLGFHTFNPFVQSLKTTESRRAIPAIYSIGTDYRFYRGMRWDVQADYDINTGFRIATGYEWQAIAQLSVKAGIYYQRYIIGCLGIGLHFGMFEADVNAELHPVLGINLLCRLAYAWL